MFSPYQQQKQKDGNYVWCEGCVNLTLAIILQYIRASNHHIEHFKCISWDVSHISVKLGGEVRIKGIWRGMCLCPICGFTMILLTLHFSQM